MRRAVLLAFVTSCSSEPALSRTLLDCTGEEGRCEEQVPHTGCSLDVGAPAADGGVGGGCGDAGARRACTRQCEGASDCPVGWECLAGSGCPGTTSVRYCVPTEQELEAQGRPGCRAIAAPEVCGFF